jgi:hypothetical protein
MVPPPLFSINPPMTIPIVFLAGKMRRQRLTVGHRDAAIFDVVLN